MSFAERYGPWALVTGASEGTGRAFARRIAAAGVRPVLVARRQAPLDALAAEIAAENGIEAHVLPVDLSSADAAARIVAGVGAREVGLVVANAGADPNGAAFLDREAAAWDALVQINVLTTMRLCHAFASPMRARGRGGLLLVNSGACYGGIGGIAAYAASKAFLLGLAEGLWAELRGNGVDVLTLVLGRTDTPAFRTLLAEKGAPVPSGLADPDAVAAEGLARLPHGPVCNVGQDDAARGTLPASAAERRARIEAMQAAAAAMFAA